MRRLEASDLMLDTCPAVTVRLGAYVPDAEVITGVDGTVVDGIIVEGGVVLSPQIHSLLTLLTYCLMP